MIISCQKCNKKFDIDQILIPEKGRLLQCSSCDHKWFFKNKIIIKTLETPTNESMEVFENKESKENNSIDLNDNINLQNKIALPAVELVKKIKIKKESNLLNLIIVFLISFIAFILLLDTFKNLLINIFPNLEFWLYNLYESIKDIRLFFKDLI